MTLSEHEKTRAAAAYVDAQLGFYIHLVVYVLVIAMLVAINYRAGGEWWAQWPAFGWGIGIVGHAIGVFGRSPSIMADWRRRRIDEVRSRM